MSKAEQSKKQGKLPFFKKRPTKIAFLILACLFIVLFTFFAYIYAQSSRIFQGNWKLSLFDNLRNAFRVEPNPAGAAEERINIVFMGIGGSNHPGGQLTDSMMVVSIKPKENALAMISVPRDLYVSVPNHNLKTKINEVYSIGDKENKGGGPDLVKQTLQNVLGIPIHYYVTLDFTGFEKIIDQLDGVDINVEHTIYDPYYPDAKMQGYDPFYLKAGQQNLNGKVALKYVRSRETSSDFDRSARQQQILVAVKDKLLSLGFLANPLKIAEIATTLGNHLRTDIAPGEIKSFANILKNIDQNNIHSKVLTDGSSGLLYSDSSSGTYYLLPKGGDYDEIQQTVKNIFNPNNEIDNVKIEIQNASGISNLKEEASEDLKSLGYSVVLTSNLKNKIAKTIIYDYSNGKYDQTLNFLKTKFSAQVLQKQPNESQNSDIVIILGENFARSNN
jgi:LCP family protein required for cell wall assembly